MELFSKGFIVALREEKEKGASFLQREGEVQRWNRRRWRERDKSMES